MQVDTLYMDTTELRDLYFDGAALLPDDVQAVLRSFMATAEATEGRYNRAAQKMSGISDPGGEPEKAYRARIHIHFVVEPA